MSDPKPALVGAFVLSGFALFVIGLMLFAGTRLFKQEFPVVTYFPDSVAGLTVGAAVTFRGVHIGSVTRIGVTINLDDLTARIPVYMELDRSAVTLSNPDISGEKATFTRLRAAGLDAQLGIESLVTGQLRVDLNLQPGSEMTLLGGNPDENEIPAHPSTLQTLEAELANLPLKEIADNANKALLSLKQVTDQLGPRVEPLLDSLTQTSDSAHATLDAAHLAVTHFDGLASDGRQQLKDNGDALRRVLASSDKTVQDADQLITSLNELTEPNSRISNELRAAIRDLAASANSLRRFSHLIENNPSDLLKKGVAQ
jgi:paraquat-inducible protein B